MAYENSNEFPDWLYNRFVEAFRKDDISKALIMSDVLREYINLVLQQRKFNKQKRHANSHYNAIIHALKNGTAHRLLLTGDEGKREYEKKIADYEQHLRSYGYTEEEIWELVIGKKTNDGS